MKIQTVRLLPFTYLAFEKSLLSSPPASSGVLRNATLAKCHLGLGEKNDGCFRRLSFTRKPSRPISCNVHTVSQFSLLSKPTDVNGVFEH